MNASARISKQIDVIIPCFNAVNTLADAVQSALNQAAVNQVWIVNDGSTDESESLAQSFVEQMPDRVKLLNMPKNSGVAMARNWAAMHVKQPYIAFLDADDVYEDNALDAVTVAFDCIPELALVRLALKPWGIPELFSNHAEFSRAWRSCEMTVAGNMVVSRHVFLALGGFPLDELFQKLGGEDVALGLAMHDRVMVGTLFDQPGVLYRYREGCHCERLLKAHLFNDYPANITAEDVVQANQVTESIKMSLKTLSSQVNGKAAGVQPLVVNSV